MPRSAGECPLTVGAALEIPGELIPLTRISPFWHRFVRCSQRVPENAWGTSGRRLNARKPQVSMTGSGFALVAQAQLKHRSSLPGHPHSDRRWDHRREGT